MAENPMDTSRASAAGIQPPWFALPAEEAVRAFDSDSRDGLTTQTADERLRVDGPNLLPTPPEPTVWQLILKQWQDPMTVLLTVLIGVCIVAAQPETAVLVTLLVLLNVSMGARQEAKARSSVAALESLNAPTARVRRDGTTSLIPAADLVVGDILILEAGDLIPADARLIRAAGVEVVESSLTGESAPVDKDAAAIEDADVPLGDRSSVVFQNTSVTRGSAEAVVVATGVDTEMGRIASMLADVRSAPSPLQKELRQLTIRLAIVCLVAVAFIIVIGLFRGLDANAIMLVAIATAISSIPSGLPTFLNAMLSYGAQRLARAKAVVRNLTDVETLGSVSAINSDKTGTLTMDMMTAVAMYGSGQWFTIEGEGYSTSGQILHAAGTSLPDFTALGYGLTLCSDASVKPDGSVIGDPTELALVVLAAKMGVDADVSRREYPRVALLPFDSSYKFMATFHLAPLTDGAEDSLIGLVKGAPDIVLDRCSYVIWGEEVVPIADVREHIREANAELARQGLRVMSFAYRAMDPTAATEVAADPMAAVEDLVFVALVGIIDPLRPAAKDAIRIALHAGIDVRMITGDHAVTAKAIADDLGLGPGVVTGPEFAAMSDEQLRARLPMLHVFGRVSPQDKLRLVEVMQESGQIVAMTGDAVNDAAALKKADIGVAMGSGSEVSKQSAKMILTDNNFATLVHAVELGRDIYGKISGQIRYVMTGLFGVLALMLLASVLNINAGNALTAVQLLFVTFLIGLFPAIAISSDTVEEGIMDAPPRDPGVPILNSSTLPRWLTFGVIQACVGILAFWLATRWGADTSEAQTMTFATVGWSTVLVAASLRRDTTPGWHGPFLPYFLWLAVPFVLTWLAVDWEVFQPMLGTVGLNGSQWGLVLLLALVTPVVIELEKWTRRLRVAGTSSPARQP